MKVVLSRINAHLETNNLTQPYQSAYRKFHSTETALLKVHSDLANALEKKMAILILLDLSASFDTIDHSILLQRLADRFNVNGTALSRIKSYLTNRSQKVKAAGQFSKEANLPFGVPQGSILGPILFSLYTSPIGDIAARNGICVHLYADDTQLYVTLDNRMSALDSIERCITEIKNWMTANFLRLNPDKTEVLLIGTTHQLKKHSTVSVNTGDCVTTSSESVRNLGAYFDKTLSMNVFVKEKCKSAVYNIKCISQIRRFLTKEATETLVNAYVTSRLDYCLSLLYGSNMSLITKLQRVQNMAARVICKVSKYDHIKPFLYQLHWLPIEKRIVFRILVYTYKALHGDAPKYLCDMIQVYEPTRALRSSSQCLLVEKSVKTKFGIRAFENNSAFLWNQLPFYIRSSSSLIAFRKALKTLLFKEAYSNIL